MDVTAGEDVGSSAALGRRGVLRLGVAGLASVLSACADADPDRDRARERPLSTQPSTDGASATTASGTSDSQAEPTEAATTPSAPALPSREDIVRTFGAQAPVTFGLEVPGIVLSHAGAGVALTFDLCGGPQGESLDHQLWKLLQKHGIPSTFFMNSRWLKANPSLARELAADPKIEIANHGHEHRPLTVDGSAAYGIRGTRDAGAAYDEVGAPVGALTKLSGSAPLWFRSGTAHCDDVGVRIAEALGQRVVNFSINGDAGATFSAQQVATEVGRAGNGDIVIAHANQPGSGTAAGMALALPEMLARGVTFARLADVLSAASVLDVDH